jgi:hypothetical protein
LRPRTIATRNADVTLGEDGVLRVVVRDGADVTADDMRAFLAARMELAPHRVGVLIDQRRIRTMTREAQEAGTVDADKRPTLGVAILIAGPIAVMIANFFIIFGRPRYPTKLFSNEPAALAWLDELRRADASVAAHQDGP